MTPDQLNLHAPGASNALFHVSMGDKLYSFDVNHGTHESGNRWLQLNVSMDGPYEAPGMQHGECVRQRWENIGELPWADFLNGLEPAYLKQRLFGKRGDLFDGPATIHRISHALESGWAHHHGYSDEDISATKQALSTLKQTGDIPTTPEKMMEALAKSFAGRDDAMREAVSSFVMFSYATRLAKPYAEFMDKAWPAFIDQAKRGIERDTHPAAPEPAFSLRLSDSGVESDLVAKVYAPMESGYQEVSIAIFDKDGNCCGDVIVGIDPNRELRVAITSDGQGDGDKNIVVYPQRPAEEAVEVDVHNSKQGRSPKP